MEFNSVPRDCSTCLNFNMETPSMAEEFYDDLKDHKVIWCLWGIPLVIDDEIIIENYCYNLECIRYEPDMEIIEDLYNSMENGD